MIKLTPNPTFPVDIELPVPGEAEPGKLTLHVRWMSRTDRQAWFEAAKQKEDADALHEVLAGWEGPVDESGAPVPYTLDALKALLNNYEKVTDRVVKAIAQGYREGRVKN
jgi:hypothetical protein